MSQNETYLDKQFRKIRELAGDMDERQVKLWCLLSLCRTNQCFLILAKMDACSGLADFGEILDAMHDHLYSGHRHPGHLYEAKIFQKFIPVLTAALDVCSSMYWDEKKQDLFDLPAGEDLSRTELEDGFSPHMFFDLIIGITEYLAHFPHLDNLGEKRNDCCAGLILGAVFEPYFFMKYDTEDLETVKEATVEVQRVWNDYHFILSHPKPSEVGRRLQEYRQICIWKQRRLHHQENTRAVINRMNRAIGHMEAVRTMIENGRDSSEVLTQIAAVRSAISNIGKIILEDHISHCVMDAVETGDEQILENLNDAISRFVR